MYINQVMSASVNTCSNESTLDEIARQMWSADCGAIPVVDDDSKPIGIVTDRDIAMAAMLNHEPLWNITAATVIKGQELCSCSQQDTVEEGLGKMEEKGVRRLLVTDGGDRLVGILSMGDALALTRPGQGGKKKPEVSVDHLLGMLRKVSAPHQHANHAVIRVS